jgi:ribosome biogenesis protein MAK21
MADVIADGEGELKVKDRKEKRKAPVEDLKAIQADVASFAASLGFSGGAGGGIASGGFDDSDFRKKGPISKKGSKIAAELSDEDEFETEVETKKRTKEKGETKAKKGKKKKKEEDELDDSGEEEEVVKPRKAKKEKSSVVEEAVASDKSTKKGTKPVPGLGKIHEVLNSAFDGKVLPTETKKRKGNWNDQQQGEENGGPLPAKRSFLVSGNSDVELVRKLREEAQQLLDKAAEEYERSRRNNSDAQWLMQARRSGTSTDRVAAMTVILQENPKANVRTLDALIGTYKSGFSGFSFNTTALNLEQMVIFE